MISANSLIIHPYPVCGPLRTRAPQSTARTGVVLRAYRDGPPLIASSIRPERRELKFGRWAKGRRVWATFTIWLPSPSSWRCNAQGRVVAVEEQENRGEAYFRFSVLQRGREQRGAASSKGAFAVLVVELPRGRSGRESQGGLCGLDLLGLRQPHWRAWKHRCCSGATLSL